MKRLVTAIVAAGLAGCAGMDWSADDKRVGYVQDTGGTPQDTLLLKDPVSGETVTLDSPWQATHDGKTYYFASEDSMKKFQENPSGYVEAEVR
ncbi:MAG TPA: YHS domain-containing protein [Planctomycetota bacterium]